MLLVNREEDPVALKEPLVPDSMTKLCIDLFSDRSTSGLLYTSDLKVLVDIITRNLSDRGPGDEVRYMVQSVFTDCGDTAVMVCECGTTFLQLNVKCACSLVQYCCGGVMPSNTLCEMQCVHQYTYYM